MQCFIKKLTFLLTCFSVSFTSPLFCINVSHFLTTKQMSKTFALLLNNDLLPISQIMPYGKLYSSKAYINYPQSLSDVQAIICKAQFSDKSISISGKLLSQGKQAISNQDENILINTSQLNQIVIDPLLKVAKVGAGASWGELQKEANKYGLAVRVMQASNIFSIGGSISANCHGWDYKTGSLCHTLIGLTVVNATGKVLNLRPTDSLFDFIVGGYGGFGVIVDATFSLTDNVNLVEHAVEIAPSDYINYFNQHVRDNQDIDLHRYRLSFEPHHFFRTGIAVNYQKIDDAPVIANLIDEPESGSYMHRCGMYVVRRLPCLRSLTWKLAKKEAFIKKTASRNEVMRVPTNFIFNHSKRETDWLQEYFVNEENLVEFLNFLSHLLQENKVSLFNASVRFVKQDLKTKLSYAPVDRFAIVLFFNQKLSSEEIQKTKDWIRQVIDYLVAHEGTYYLPYQHFATVEQFKACYPNWKSVISYKQAIDPENLFNNGFFADYLISESDKNSNKSAEKFNYLNSIQL